MQILLPASTGTDRAQSNTEGDFQQWFRESAHSQGKQGSCMSASAFNTPAVTDFLDMLHRQSLKLKPWFFLFRRPRWAQTWVHPPYPSQVPATPITRPSWDILLFLQHPHWSSLPMETQRRELSTLVVLQRWPWDNQTQHPDSQPGKQEAH